jgi:hypothetical protein
MLAPGALLRLRTKAAREAHLPAFAATSTNGGSRSCTIDTALTD